MFPSASAGVAVKHQTPPALDEHGAHQDVAEEPRPTPGPTEVSRHSHAPPIAANRGAVTARADQTDTAPSARRGGPRSSERGTSAPPAVAAPGRGLARQLDVSSPPAWPPGSCLVPSGLWNGPARGALPSRHTPVGELDEVDGEVLLVEAAGRRSPQVSDRPARRR